MKADAQQQVRELLAKIEIANNKFAKEVAPNNKELSELDNRRLDLEEEISISQQFIKKYSHQVPANMLISASPSYTIPPSEKERDTLKQQLSVLEKEIAKLTDDNKRI